MPRATRIVVATFLALAGMVPLGTTAQGNLIRIIVPYAPGGSNDIIARLIAPKLSEQAGETVIVENRAGAGSNIGSEAVARSAPDGRTLLLGSPANAVNVSLYSKMAFDPRKDLTRVTLIGTSPNVLVVHPSLTAKSVAEFIALGKSSAGGVTYASSGSGGAMHLSGELFKMLTGANLVHVPYRGAGPAVADLVGGQVQAMFDNLITALPNIKSERVRPLGVTSRTRVASLPGVPTIEEAGVTRYESYVWWGVFAAGGTPPAVVSRLQQHLAAAIRSPDVSERLRSQGIDPIASTPEAFESFYDAEVEKWAKVVKEAKVKVE